MNQSKPSAYVISLVTVTGSSMDMKPKLKVSKQRGTKVLPLSYQMAKYLLYRPLKPILTPRRRSTTG